LGLERRGKGMTKGLGFRILGLRINGKRLTVCDLQCTVSSLCTGSLEGSTTVVYTVVSRKSVVDVRRQIQRCDWTEHSFFCMFLVRTCRLWFLCSQS